MDTNATHIQNIDIGTNGVIKQLQGRMIYIVGLRCFQNELLSYMLQIRLGVKCVSFDSVLCGSESEEVSVNKGILVLLDVNGKTETELQEALETKYKKLISCFLVAFININQGIGIERSALCNGIKGFFYDNDSIDLFIKGVQAIFNGELWVSREVLTQCVQVDSVRYLPKKDSYMKKHFNLSKRELEILALITVGAKNDEIAFKLCISTHTVKTHLYNVFKKIHVDDRLQAALWAAKHL